MTESSNDQGSPAATNEQIFWIIVTAYIGKAVDLLDATTENKLDRLFAAQSQSWIAQVEHALGIDFAFVRAVYELCTKQNNPGAAVGFLLRGLGCPTQEVDARIRELNIPA